MDTETTGFYKRDRIIEIGVVEIINGQIEDRLHHYVNPAMAMGAGALRVHGITDEMLKEKPAFAQLVPALIELVQDAQLIVHNAPFDTYYINFELALRAQKQREEYKAIEEICGELVDSLVVAREKFPGQPNSLDALAARCGIEASGRAERHGALIDARLLASVYQVMCISQSSFDLAPVLQDSMVNSLNDPVNSHAREDFERVQPSAVEKKAHLALMKKICKDA